MKKLYLFLAIAFLFQSCFTYKASDITPDKMAVGDKYKIQRNNKYEKVVIKRITDSTAVVLKGSKEKSIPLAEITQVKKRKFSIIKTVGLPVAVVATITGLFALTYDGPQTGGISFSK